MKRLFDALTTIIVIESLVHLNFIGTCCVYDVIMFPDSGLLAVTVSIFLGYTFVLFFLQLKHYAVQISQR